MAGVGFFVVEVFDETEVARSNGSAEERTDPVKFVIRFILRVVLRALCAIRTNRSSGS